MSKNDTSRQESLPAYLDDMQKRIRRTERKPSSVSYRPIAYATVPTPGELPPSAGTPQGTQLLVLSTGQLATNGPTGWTFSAPPVPGSGGSGMSQADVDARIIAVGDPRFVNVTGDSMTGQLRFPSGGNFLVSAGDGSYQSWYNAGFANRRGYLQGNADGLLLNSEAGTLKLYGAGGLTLSPFTINGYTGSAGVVGNRIVLTNSSGYIHGNYINMTAEVLAGWPAYIAGQNGDNFLRWYNKSGALSVGGLSASGQIMSTKAGTAPYWDASIFANPASSYASVGLHPGGVAGSWRMAGNFMVHQFVDVNGTLYAPIYASAFTVNSTRASKQDVTPWPPKVRSLGAAANTLTALGIVRQLEVVSYRRRFDQAMVEALPVRRAKAHYRLNQFRANRGLDPYPDKLHDCDDSDCIGTSDNPCPWYRNWEQTSLGLIVEDTADVAPELVRYDEHGAYMGIDVHSHVGLLHAAIKELESRLTELEGAA